MSDIAFIAPASPQAPTSDDAVQMAAYLAAAEKTGSEQAPTTTSDQRTRVMIESPFAGRNMAAAAMNRLYGREALRDSLLRGEAPIASRMLYTQTFVLNDDNPDERELIELASASWLPLMDRVVVYIDRGITPHMEAGIRRAQELGVPVEERSIPSWKRG